MHQLIWNEYSDKFKGLPILILGNKQDVKEAMSMNLVGEIIQLSQMRNREWHFQPVCAKTGDGLYEAVDWITSENKRRVYEKNNDFNMHLSTKL